MSGAKLLQDFDGAHPTAVAVLALVRGALGDGIEESWDKELHRYMAEPKFCRFDNCREQGYFIFMGSGRFGWGNDQINIAFAENRNSDAIRVLVFEKKTFNAPTLADIPEEAWGSSKFFKYDEHFAAAEFIAAELKAFWHRTAETETAVAA